MNIAKTIDHTLLKPDAVWNDIEKLCTEAEQYNFCSVCILPQWVSKAKSRLEHSDVKVCTVIGFPLGMTYTKVKEYETRLAVDEGADELDMVIPIADAKDGDWTRVENEIKAVLKSAKDRWVKVIIESGLLTNNEIVKASQCVERAGAHFVKTSTGFLGSGATLDAVSLIRKSVSSNIGIKASGGIRSYKDAVAMLQAGATRIGTSSGVKIVQEQNENENNSYTP